MNERARTRLGRRRSLFAPAALLALPVLGAAGCLDNLMPVTDRVVVGPSVDAVWPSDVGPVWSQYSKPRIPAVLELIRVEVARFPVWPAHAAARR